MVVDPVCKMNVDPAKTKHVSTHMGKPFYFCSAACKTQFDRAPEKYAK
ncbi:MAG: YHS domain-containing protein [Candidatus Caldarchaeum sp.]|nr:YHS domain-containing protein [Candidatus Caldarchaeum sp.]